MIAKNYIFGRQYASANPYLADLVAYYRFDSNSNDFSGNGHNGTDTSISYANAGLVSNCATFTPSSSKIFIPQSTDFDFSNGSNDLQFSMSFWAKTNNASATQWVLGKHDATTAQYDISIQGGFIYILLYTNSSTYILCRHNDMLVNGVWNHFCITYNASGINTGIKIYKNGVFGTGNSYGAGGTYTKMPISSQSFVFGVDNWAGQVAWLNGGLDEVAIWKNRLLTSGEAMDLYNKGIVGTPII